MGVAAALQLPRGGNENCPLLIWFSDNITNINLKRDVDEFTKGAILLTREVENPGDFGIAILDGDAVVDVVEKPENPPGNLAIGGIYIFDERFWKDWILYRTPGILNFRCYQTIPCRRGCKGNLSGENTWIDCGTPENLQRAARMVQDGLFTIRGE